MSVIHDIEIDHCPNCKGVWLDRGELDKIIEQANSFESQDRRRNVFHEHHDDHEKHYNKHHDHHYDRSHENKFEYGNETYRNQQRHRKGFLSELFDF